MEAAVRLGRDDFDSIGPAARAMGVSESMLKQVEQGKRRPSFEFMETMARTYGVLMGDLLPCSTPRGAVADSIIGPIATIPEPHRSVFIAQMSGLARSFSTALGDVAHVTAETATERTTYLDVTTDILPHSPQDDVIGDWREGRSDEQRGRHGGQASEGTAIATRRRKTGAPR